MCFFLNWLAILTHGCEESNEWAPPRGHLACLQLLHQGPIFLLHQEEVCLQTKFLGGMLQGQIFKIAGGLVEELVPRVDDYESGESPCHANRLCQLNCVLFAQPLITVEKCVGIVARTGNLVEQPRSPTVQPTGEQGTW